MEAPGFRTQYGALPYRFNGDGTLEILLVTSRRTKRWIIPKGWPISGLDAAETAAREAYEEAGVVGEIEDQPVGRFRYRKVLKGGRGKVLCEVTVFPLHVETMFEEWPEVSQRQSRWLGLEAAVALASGTELKILIATASLHMCSCRMT